MTKSRSVRTLDNHLNVGKTAAMASSGAVVGAIIGGPMAALIGGALGTAFSAAANAKRHSQVSSPSPQIHSPRRRLVSAAKTAPAKKTRATPKRRVSRRKASG